jgi:hypothetical protein
VNALTCARQRDDVKPKAFQLLEQCRIRRSDRLLALAAVVSVALHALLISGRWAQVPEPPPEVLPIQARLAPARPESKPTPVSASRPRPHKPHEAHGHDRTPHAATAPIAYAAPPQPSGRDAPPAESQAASPDPGTMASVRPEPDPRAVPAPPDAVGSDETPAAAPVEEASPARNLPRKGTITFTLAFGRDGFVVGRAVQSWETDAGRYKLLSDAETIGIVDLFRPQRLRWLSQGTITPQGLRPESFLMSRTRQGRTEAAEARFDWAGDNLTYGYATERTRAALPNGTQDIMSFVYQLGLVPPAPGHFLLPITTGSRFEIYGVDVLPAETIETPLGTVRALRVRQERRPGQESIEVWLAAEYRYLPVKIRYFDREGNPAGEQLASEIRVSDE